MASAAYRLARAHTASVLGTVVLLSLVVASFLWWAIWAMLASGPWVLSGSDLPFQVGLLLAFGVAFLAWSGLHSLGYVGSGTGAGFRLALLGLGVRIHTEGLISLGGVRVGDSTATYWAPDSVPQMLCLVRATSLVAYGFGMALVAITTAVELRRRRTTPAWTHAQD